MTFRTTRRRRDNCFYWYTRGFLSNHDITAKPNRKMVIRLTERVISGDRAAAADLLPLLYDELRALAQQHVAREQPGHTFQATALVNEVYL